MALPEGFLFSQSNLQDYCDCPRRFQLRYLERRTWPAPQTANALESELRMRQGYAFHRLMRQLHSGVPPEALEPVVRAEPELAVWWENYQSMPPQGLPTELREPELTLGVGLCGYRLEARYDLLAGQLGGRWVIVDWKTAAHRTPRPVLRVRVQTRVYPWVLVHAGIGLNADAPIAPQQVEMIYWFAEAPHETEKINYSADQFQRDSAFLSALVGEIAGLSNDADGQEHRFTLTTHEDRCRFCTYRSLCDRGVKAGNLSDSEAEEADSLALLDFDFEQIAEIEF